MNIVNSGNRYQVYGEDVMTYKALPVTYYNVDFHKMMGFYLTTRTDLAVTEPKIYGTLESKVSKTLRSYAQINRNFGVLLSGQKGIGKSLFVRMLAQHAIENNLPVLIVSEAIHGIADFIASIEQDCVIVFDEFEKTFAETDDWNPQDEMLSLFDGIDGGHKLFVVTCNDVSKLSPYMINRPGRFHYHFTIGAPTQDEVREYLTDNVSSEYASSIDDLVNLAGTIDMPYDYLRAIAFELNQGYPLKEVMSDLNITRANKLRFDLKAITLDGTIYEAWNESLNLSDRGSGSFVRFRNSTIGRDLCATVHPAAAKMVDGEFIITERIDMQHFVEDDFYDLPEEQRCGAAQAANSNKIEKIILEKCPETLNPRFLV